jgi:predicted RNA-binding protein associated with RNAse of E/G family
MMRWVEKVQRGVQHRKFVTLKTDNSLLIANEYRAFPAVSDKRAFAISLGNERASLCTAHTVC